MGCSTIRLVRSLAVFQEYASIVEVGDHILCSQQKMNAVCDSVIAQINSQLSLANVDISCTFVEKSVKGSADQMLNNCSFSTPLGSTRRSPGSMFEDQLK